MFDQVTTEEGTSSSSGYCDQSCADNEIYIRNGRSRFCLERGKCNNVYQSTEIFYSYVVYSPINRAAELAVTLN